jgi:hypothetical protein
MRTIRTKVYQFSELSEQAKIKAIRDEVSKFRNYFCLASPDTMTAIEEEKYQAGERIKANEYEFKADGTRF